MRSGRQERLEEEKNVLVHPYRNGLLKDYIRVSTGSTKAMKKFFMEFIEVDGGLIAWPPSMKEAA